MTPLYFASGSNRPADIRGFAAIGHAIGVAAHEVTANAEKELLALRGTGVQVFVDSGAFSEVEFGAAGVSVVAPIDHAAWTERLALYRRLAVALGPQVHVVAPDRIGDQEETLRRLSRYAPELRELRALGANVLVPIQKGTKAQAAFVRDVEEAIGFSIRNFRTKKNADGTKTYLPTLLPVYVEQKDREKPPETCKHCGRVRATKATGCTYLYEGEEAAA